MKTVKTAISLHRLLFEQAEEIAKKMHISRSRLISMALEEYLAKMKNQDLLDRINSACDFEDDAAEKKLKQNSSKAHRRLVEDEW